MRSIIYHFCFSVVFANACVFSVSAAERLACDSAGERRLKFSTQELSLANLDVSPDGRWIVFDMLGDLYVLPVDGGEANKITGGFGWDSRPVWSPDGKRIAFISDRLGNDQVFVVNVHGERQLKQITFQRQLAEVKIALIEGELRAVEWMPNSTHVLVGGYVFAAGRQGGLENSMPKKFDSELYFGSSKGLFYFKPVSSKTLGSVALALDKRLPYELWKLEGQARTKLTSGLNLSPWWRWEAPAASGDARWIVYGDRSPIKDAPILDPAYVPAAGEAYIDTIRVYDRKNELNRVLVGPAMSPGWRNNGGPVDELGISATTRYAISPDSQYLFIAYGGKIHRIDLKSGTDEVVPMTAKVDKCLKPIVQNRFSVEDADFKVKSIRSASRSPDGKHLIFSALRRLYIMDLRTGQSRLFHVQPDGQFEPSYSPDGKWIAFVTWSDTGGGHLWRAKVDGSSAEILTREAGYYQSPVWSADGKRIAYVGSSDLAVPRPGFDVEMHGGNLHVIEVYNRAVNQLPQRATFGGGISFSGDGNRIYYMHYLGNYPESKLFSVNIDGTEEHDEKLETFFSRAGLTSLVVQSGGMNIALVKFGNLYLVHCEQPIGSGTSFRVDKCREIPITRDGGNDPRWREGGRVLEWSFGSTYYSADINDLLSQNRIGDGEEGRAELLDEKFGLKQIDIDLVASRSRQVGVLALVGARIITMRGDEVINDGVIVIRDGRIVHVGPSYSVSIPRKAKVIDVTGKTIVPGLIDAHAHFNNMPRDILAGNHWEPLVSLAYGITTIRNPSAGGDHAYAYAELAETGRLIGPRMFVTPGLVGGRTERIESLSDALNIAAREKRLGATFLKYHTGFNRLQRSWIIEAARQSGLRVASHFPANTQSTGRLNLSLIYDGTSSAEHEISDASDLFDDVKQFLVRSEVKLCFTPINGYGGYPSLYWPNIQNDVRTQRFYHGQIPSTKSAVLSDDAESALPPLRLDAESNAKFISGVASEAGDSVMIGSHGDYTGIGMHLEMWAHARGGMSPMRVLRAATLNGARGIGVESDLGSLEPGKVADLLVLGRNPLADIRNTLSIEMVLKGGVVRDAHSLDEIWPTARVLPGWRIQKTTQLESNSTPPALRH